MVIELLFCLSIYYYIKIIILATYRFSYILISLSLHNSVKLLSLQTTRLYFMTK